MKRVVAVLTVSFLMILMVAAISVGYLGAPAGLQAIEPTATTVQLALGDAPGLAGAAPRAAARLAVGALDPTDLTLFGYRVQNVGDTPGVLRLVDLTYGDHEFGCQPTERDAGDLSCGDPGPTEGELSRVALLRLFRDAGCDFVLNAGDQFVGSAEVDALPATLDLALPLAAGKEACLIFALERARSSQLTHGALAVGDTLDIDLVFELTPSPTPGLP